MKTCVKKSVRLWKGVDDVTGRALDPKLIRQARAEEMSGFRAHGVYHHVSRAEAMNDETGKFIGVRWVDHDKGTPSEPNVRSRLVEQEFATKGRRGALLHRPLH